MQWYVSKELDAAEEVHERVKFYESLTRRKMCMLDVLEDYFMFSDGRSDNRCMIIGHTDAIKAIIDYLWSKGNKKYKLYLSVCEMDRNFFLRIRIHR